MTYRRGVCKSLVSLQACRISGLDYITFSAAHFRNLALTVFTVCAEDISGGSEFQSMAPEYDKLFLHMSSLGHGGTYVLLCPDLVGPSGFLNMSHK